MSKDVRIGCHELGLEMNNNAESTKKPADRNKTLIQEIGDTWWTKSNWGGKSSGTSACFCFNWAWYWASSSGSLSNAKSHILKPQKQSHNLWERCTPRNIRKKKEPKREIQNHKVPGAGQEEYVNWWSAEVTLSVDDSWGLHSIDVMGSVWYLKWATNVSSCTCEI